MKIDLTKRQVERFAALISAKNKAEADINLALAVLADGVGLEKWVSVGLDPDSLTLTFVEDEPVAPAEPDSEG